MILSLRQHDVLQKIKCLAKRSNMHNSTTDVAPIQRRDVEHGYITLPNSRRKHFDGQREDAVQPQEVDPRKWLNDWFDWGIRT